MSELVLEFEGADASTRESLATLWNRAYDGYYVPLSFKPEQLDRHVRRAGVKLDLSRVGRIEGLTFGLSLAASLGEQAWIGGFGIAPEFRRKGLATRLIQAQCEALDAAGVKRTRLEVIDFNPARRVYEAAGFTAQRELLLLEGRSPDGGEAGCALSFDEVVQAHGAAHDPAPPTWRRSLPSLVKTLMEERAVIVGVKRGESVAAFAVCVPELSRVVLIDAAAADLRAAEALLSALGARWPHTPLRLVDEPGEGPIARAWTAAGFEVPLRQVEMVRRRG